MFVYMVRRGYDQLLLASRRRARCTSVREGRARLTAMLELGLAECRGHCCWCRCGVGAPRHLNGPLPTHGRTTKICKQTTRLKSSHVVVQTLQNDSIYTLGDHLIFMNSLFRNKRIMSFLHVLRVKYFQLSVKLTFLIITR